MKKINLALLCIIMHCAMLNAQTNYTYTQIVDSALFPGNKTYPNIEVPVHGLQFNGVVKSIAHNGIRGVAKYKHIYPMLIKINIL